MKKLLRKFIKIIDRGRLEKRIWLGVYSVPFKIRFINFVFQRILRINSECPWPVNFTSTVLAPKNIELGQGVGRYISASRGCYITGFNGVKIGDGTLIGPNVGIISANHDLKDRSQTKENPIVIGKNCWIGMGSVILPGVNLGDNVTVGAGAVVTKDFPDGVLVAGIPAKIIEKTKKEN